MLPQACNANKNKITKSQNGNLNILETGNKCKALQTIFEIQFRQLEQALQNNVYLKARFLLICVGVCEQCSLIVYKLLNMPAQQTRCILLGVFNSTVQNLHKCLTYETNACWHTHTYTHRYVCIYSLVDVLIANEILSELILSFLLKQHNFLTFSRFSLKQRIFTSPHT